jgi:hypothetical protein
VTKYFATVCLAPVPTHEIVSVLTSAMAPYYIDTPDGKHSEIGQWDWFRLRAPDSGLLVRAGYERDVQVLRSLDDPQEAVAAPKFMIDFDAVVAEERDRAAGSWDAWSAVTARHPQALPLTHFLASTDIEADAKRLHLSQPAVQELTKAAASQEHPYFNFSILLADPVVYYGADRDAFVAQAEAHAVATYAYISLDGRWHDQYTDNLSSDAHAAAMRRYLADLPDDAIIAIVRCHC